MEIAMEPKWIIVNFKNGKQNSRYGWKSTDPCKKEQYQFGMNNPSVSFQSLRRGGHETWGTQR